MSEEEKKDVTGGAGVSGDYPSFRDSPAKKVGLGIVLALLIIVLAGATGAILWAMFTGDDVSGELVLGESVGGEIGPDTPIGAARKPFVDYIFKIARHGTYRIDLISEDPENYDPFLSVLSEGNLLTSDNDGGQGKNATVEREFRPGEYIVRVTSYDVNVPDRPVPYNLTAIGY